MWLGGKPIYLNGSQIAEVLRDINGYLIRNLRPNGNVGVCFSCNTREEIRPWLDANYPGWTQ